MCIVYVINTTGSVRGIIGWDWDEGSTARR